MQPRVARRGPEGSVWPVETASPAAPAPEPTHLRGHPGSICHRYVVTLLNLVSKHQKKLNSGRFINSLQQLTHDSVVLLKVSVFLVS